MKCELTMDYAESPIKSKYNTDVASLPTQSAVLQKVYSIVLHSIILLFLESYAT